MAGSSRGFPSSDSDSSSERSALTGSDDALAALSVGDQYTATCNICRPGVSFHGVDLHIVELEIDAHFISVHRISADYLAARRTDHCG